MSPIPADCVRRIGLGVLFALGYGGVHYYTSNQHTYLLHALAAVRPGVWPTDWLVHTHDAFPAFTSLTTALLTLGGWQALYATHGLLIALFALVLLGIAQAGSPPPHPPAYAFRLWLVLMLASSTPAIRRFFFEGVADQYLLRSYYQPAGFGVLLLVALWCVANQRPLLAASLAPIAAILHPTYLPSALFLCAAIALGSWIRKQRALAVAASAVALVLLCPPLLQVSSLLDPSAELNGRAQWLMATQRIPHHALISTWFARHPLESTAKCALVLAAILHVWPRNRALGWALAISAGSALVLTLAAWVSGSAGLALLFPWRASTWLVPCSTALLAGSLLTIPVPRAWPSRALTWCGTAIALLLLWQGTRSHFEALTARGGEEAVLHDLARQHTAPHELLIVPPELESFRVDVQRAVVVDEKSHPFRTNEFLEWWQRLQTIRRVYDPSLPTAMRAAQLERAGATYGASRALLRSTDPLAAELHPQAIATAGPWTLLALPGPTPGGPGLHRHRASAHAPRRSPIAQE